MLALRSEKCPQLSISGMKTRLFLHELNAVADRESVPTPDLLSGALDFEHLGVFHLLHCFVGVVRREGPLKAL